MRAPEEADTTFVIIIIKMEIWVHHTWDRGSLIVETGTWQVSGVYFCVFTLSKQLFHRADDFIWKVRVIWR